MIKENNYYSDDGMLSNSFLKAVLEGPIKIKAFFDNIGKKTKKKHYILGSAVDHLLTDPETFKDVYIKVDFKNPSPNVCLIVDDLFDEFSNNIKALAYIPDKAIHELCKFHNWYADDKFVNSRVDKLKNEGGLYYNHLYNNKHRYILSSEEFDKVNGVANLLETHPHTTGFFNLDKMKGVICAKSKRIDWTTGAGGSSMHKCKSLLDRIYINTTDEDIVLANGFVFLAKSILVIDYKTVFGYIYQWLEKFYEYRYDFQGAFYYGAAQYQAQVIKSKKKETYKVLNPLFLVGSFTDNYTVWYQMTNDDLKRGRLGDDEVKGYFDAVKLYEQYKESGQWEIPPSLLANFGKLG